MLIGCGTMSHWGNKYVSTSRDYHVYTPSWPRAIWSKKKKPIFRNLFLIWLLLRLWNGMRRATITRVRRISLSFNFLVPRRRYNCGVPRQPAAAAVAWAAEGSGHVGRRRRRHWLLSHRPRVGYRWAAVASEESCDAARPDSSTLLRYHVPACGEYLKPSFESHDIAEKTNSDTAVAYYQNISLIHYYWALRLTLLTLEQMLIVGAYMHFFTFNSHNIRTYLNCNVSNCELLRRCLQSLSVAIVTYRKNLSQQHLIKKNARCFALKSLILSLLAACFYWQWVRQETCFACIIKLFERMSLINLNLEILHTMLSFFKIWH
jgi:hypothetical protein